MRTSAALLLAVVACTSRGSEAAERQADTTGRRDSIAAVAAASMHEAEILGLLDHVHATDAQVGTLGATRGAASTVREFGRMIMREHSALRRDAQELAQGLRLMPVTPRVAPDAPSGELQRQVERASSGAIWDQLYLSYAIAWHEASMENAARALAATRSPATRQLITRAVPIFQKHLDKARALQATLQRARDPAS